MNYIMVSGDNEKHLSKIDTLNGIIMLNLEDGVAKNKKDIALNNIEKVLETTKKTNFVVRVNSIEDGGLNEIKRLNKFNVEFRIPKIENNKQLKKVFDITNNDISISIETKEAFYNLLSFDRRIKKFYLGILDLFDDFGLSHQFIQFDNPLIQKILVDFSLNSAYLKIIPIGFVYQHYKDLEGFTKWCKIQRDVGIKGVGCITPKQLEIANDIFKDDDLEFAKFIVDKFENEGVFTINGLYVDEPIYKNYKLMLDK